MRNPACRHVVSPFLPCLLLLLITVSASASFAAAPLFKDPLYSVDQSPIAIVAADFNGDHAIDLALLNGQSKSFSILLAYDGDFPPQPYRRFPVPHYPGGMATGDFDHNGLADLVITDSVDDQAIIYLSFGDGIFFQGGISPTGRSPKAVVVADLNGDGVEDLAVANQISNDVSIILRTANGALLPHGSFAAGGTPYAMAVTDFNKDGHPDLAVALLTDAKEAVMLFGHGDGMFDPPFSLGGDPGGISIASGDFNQDGSSDLAIGAYFPDRVSILLGDGAGGVLSRKPIDFQGNPNWLGVADFNGDGAPDLATANAILPGYGDGSFEAAVRYTTVLATGAIADIDADGALDVAAVNDSMPPGAVVLYGDGHGQVGPRVEMMADHRDAIVKGDFNGDGLVDLAASGMFSDQVSVLLSHGNGSFAPEILSPAGAQVFGMAAGDFDGDGRLDLVVYTNLGDFVSLLRGKGDGSFLAPVSTTVGITPRALAAGDFNADGRDDLVSLKRHGEFVLVLLGKADGTFQVFDQVGPQQFATAAAVADFNGDGKLDLAVAYPNTESVSILAGHGDGTFTPGAFYGAGDHLQALAAADLDGDGILDLAAGHANLGVVSSEPGCCEAVTKVSVLLGLGGGVLGAETRYDVAQWSVSIDIADFDLDGTLDIMSSGSALLSGAGDGAFLPVRQFTHFGPSVIVDFNSDGRPDVAVARGGIIVALNQPPFTNHPPVAAAGPNARLDCASPAGAEVLLDGTASSDPDSTFAGSDLVSFDWFEDYGRPRQRLLGAGETLSVTLSLGTHRITLRVTDHAGASATDDMTIKVVVGSRCARPSFIRRR